MRNLIIPLGLGLVLLLTQTDFLAANEQIIPSIAGGFTLNSSIEDYDLESYDNYLREVIVTNLEGYHKGFITYGTCENQGKILRIKLKYENRSSDFFKELLKRYKNTFGSKPKFSGDQFGNVKSWKWSFTNEQGQQVTLVLQHNLKDSDESIGNMVKLSLPDLMNAERQCFNKIHFKKETKDAKQTGINSDWGQLIPK